MTNTVTIGADPELFVRNSRGRVIPMCGTLGGTKESPRALGQGFAVQEDNIMLEYNVPPATDGYMFADYISVGKERALAEVHSKTRNNSLRFSTNPEELIPKKTLEEHEGASTFGCSPEYDAYTQGEQAPTVAAHMLRSDDEDGSEWRFAGGHVHIGYNNPEIPAFVAASFCDLYLGLSAVNVDHQPHRRELYGQAGRFRPTSYGIEYRVLSNFWVHERYLAEQVGENASMCGKFLNASSRKAKQHMRKIFPDIPWGDVKQAIQQEDPYAASSIVQYCRDELKISGLHG